MFKRYLYLTLTEIMDPLWLSIYMVIQVTETGQIKKYRSNLSKTFILPKPFETLSVLDLKKKKNNCIKNLEITFLITDTQNQSGLNQTPTYNTIIWPRTATWLTNRFLVLRFFIYFYSWTTLKLNRARLFLRETNWIKDN